MQVCPICLTNAKDLALGCGHMVRTDSELLFSIIYYKKCNAIAHIETKEKKNLIYILISLCILCMRATDLQGVWGEPHQMPDLSTADTIKAEAIFRMKWLC